MRDVKPIHSGIEQLAARKNLLQTYDHLIEQNGQDWVDLMCAIENADIELAKSIIEKKAININLQDDEGFSALMLASYYGHADIVDLLIERGADVNLKNKHGDSALIFAARMGKTYIVDLLIEAGAEVNLQNSTGVSALIIAAEKRKTEIVNLLIKAGADPNLQNHAEASALIAAANEGHIDIVKLLIENGADASVLNCKKEAFENEIRALIRENSLTAEDKKRLVKLYIIFRTVEETNRINRIKSGVTAFFKLESVYREKINAAENLLKALDEPQGFSGDAPALQDGLLKKIYDVCFPGQQAEPTESENLHFKQGY